MQRKPARTAGERDYRPAGPPRQVLAQSPQCLLPLLVLRFPCDFAPQQQPAGMHISSPLCEGIDRDTLRCAVTLQPPQRVHHAQGVSRVREEGGVGLRNRAHLHSAPAPPLRALRVRRHAAERARAWGAAPVAVPPARRALEPTSVWVKAEGCGGTPGRHAIYRVGARDALVL